MPLQRTPEEAQKFRTAILSGITAGKEVKALATELKTTESYLYTILSRCGYAKMLLSPEERFVVKTFRADPKPFAKVIAQQNRKRAKS